MITTLALVIGGIVLLAILFSVCIVPQKQKYIIERLEKYHVTLSAGLNILFPIIGRVSLLLVLGLIFFVTVALMKSTGITSLPIIASIITSLATSAFLLVKNRGKNNVKSNANLDGNAYDGKTFFAYKTIPTDGTLLVLGFIFLVTEVLMAFTGVTILAMIAATIASLATFAFFLIKDWRKK